MKWKVIGLLAVTVTLYLVVGALVFPALERAHETRVREELLNRTQQFVVNFSCVPEEDVRRLISFVLEAQSSGVNAEKLDSTSDPSNWDFASSLFFSLTVVTTIGYGNFSPSTSGGRLFCMFYGLFGIPLMLLLLAGIGEKLHDFVVKVEDFEVCKGSLKKAKYLKCVLVVLVGYTIFILVPAVIFRHFEGWSLGESVYFAMVTLTTIGFGDFIAGTGGPYQYRSLYHVSLVVWTVVGLAWLSLVIGSLQDAGQNIVDKTEAMHSTIMAKRDTEKSGDDELSMVIDRLNQDPNHGSKTSASNVQRS